jgi:uncharacterized protein
MKRPARRALHCVALGLLVLLLGFIMLRYFEHSQVYHPDKLVEATGAELGRPLEDMNFRAADGVALHGWFFPAATNSARQQLAILYCHGNAGNISDRLDVCAALLQTGANLLAFDYRGYGRSQGKPNEEGTYQDAQAALAWLKTRGFANTRIIAFGESLGGGVVSELALREKLGGLILQSTFTSIPDMGAEIFPWLPIRWLGSIKYDTLNKLSRVHVPVLIMHSQVDGLIPLAHAKRNFAAANEPKIFWELKGIHNDCLFDRPHFIAGIDRLLETVEKDLK